MRTTRRQSTLLVLVPSVMVVAGACATMTHSPSDDRLFVDSEPPGAAIFVQDRYVGRTPLMVDMPRDRSIRVRCSLPEYRDSYATVNREIAPGAGFDGPILPSWMRSPAPPGVCSVRASSWNSHHFPQPLRPPARGLLRGGHSPEAVAGQTSMSLLPMRNQALTGEWRPRRPASLEADGRQRVRAGSVVALSRQAVRRVCERR